MGAAVLLKQFESILGGPLGWQSRPEPEYTPTGILEVDSATGGLPRGCLTEIVGPASSGRTSLLLGILAAATARQETCALVDAEDAFSPHSAADAGVQLEHLLWVRCGHSAEHALKAGADALDRLPAALVAHVGGEGDPIDVPDVERLGEEHHNDLTGLCRTCHETFHKHGRLAA